jgi:hypothetical protein
MLSRLKSMQVQGRLEKAEATFSRMCADMPNHVYAWLGLGYCASLTNDSAKALDCFETTPSPAARL